jgi:hypothetical protein
VSNTSTETRKDWDFDRDGPLDGLYVETRQVTIRNGPSAGQTKPVIDLHVGVDDELVTLWLPAVLRRMLADELRLRGQPDFESGEHMRIVRKPEKRSGVNGDYWDFEPVVFEHPAPRPDAAAMLGTGLEDAFAVGTDDEIGF